MNRNEAAILLAPQKALAGDRPGRIVTCDQSREQITKMAPSPS